MAPGTNAVIDPVLPDQGGRAMPADPGGAAWQEAIRQRAYELYLRRGSKHGHQLRDWLDAEAQLRAECRVEALKATSA